MLSPRTHDITITYILHYRYKTQTLDSGLDCGLDYGLNYGLNFGLDFRLESRTNLTFLGLPTIHFLIAYSLVPKVVIIQIPMVRQCVGR